MISTARKLANASPLKPRQADLKRAISTAYYALFHAIAKDAANLLVGVGAARPQEAWVQVYRALQHGAAKTACEGVRNLNFPTAMKRCADAFVTLQQKRHDADYDPTRRGLRTDAVAAIVMAEAAIVCLRSSPKPERRAFAVFLLFQKCKL